MKYLIWICFIIMIVAQWYIPGNMIFGKEQILRKGELIKFQTTPIDPNDPFRGKYVFLSFKENRFRPSNKNGFDRGQEIYVVLRKDPDNYATISNISATKPGKGILFVKANADYIEENGTVHINYPFDRFYMEEFKAPIAERIYNEGRMDSTQKAYALINVLEGDAVIKDVLINDSSISELAGKRR
jgi:uncharacterized membrane-anchored protein